MKLTWINGQPGQLSLSHRGLAYGDGLFETILVNAEGPKFLGLHLQRMALGIERLSLFWSKENQQQLISHISELCSEVTEPHVLKLMLLRSDQGRGYDYDPDRQSTDVIVQLSPYSPPSWTLTGARVVISSAPISENAVLAGLKHLNRLDSVLARQDARKHGADEALLLDRDKFIVEGSMSNFYFKIDNNWRTPPLVNAGVNGIMRQHLLARNIIAEQSVSARNLDKIEAAALSNSLIGIQPIAWLADRRLPVQNELASLLKN